MDATSIKMDIKIIKEELRQLRADHQTRFDRLQNTLDGFVGRIDDLSTENTVGTYQIRELREKADDHEQRLKHLETTKHPV